MERYFGSFLKKVICTVVANGSEQKLYIDNVTIHPKYDWNTKKVHSKYDIAVIKLKTSVEWTKWVRPICLPGLFSLVHKTWTAQGPVAGRVFLKSAFYP